MREMSFVCVLVFILIGWWLAYTVDFYRHCNGQVVRAMIGWACVKVQGRDG